VQLCRCGALTRDSQDLREGTGATPKRGSRVTVDWDGYTIGYYGRVFQARNRAKGGAFSSEEDELLRWAVGSGACIPALDEAVLGMKVGGIRRIYVSPGPLFYPLGPNGAVTQAGRKLLPQPSTFSGQRSLYFVLENQGLVDKSLLFDLELKRVD
jgi:FKBP-type peptidyl-prolyl cis-trans isomerase